MAEQLRKAEPDVLAYLAFPQKHWRSISSTNTIERLNAESIGGPRWSALP